MSIYGQPTYQGWMGQTSGNLGGGQPLIQGPLISRQKRDDIKQGFQNFFGGNNNPYQTAQTPIQGGNVMTPQMDPGIFQSGKKPLQSSAKTGRISGGTAAQRAEAKSLAGSGPNVDALSGGTQAVASLGTAALDAIDKDPGFGGADAGKMALQGAALGANPALVAATGGLSIVAGAVIGGTVGLIKKKKYEKEEKKRKAKESQKIKDDRMRNRNVGEAQNFFAGQSAANQAAYTGQDIDMFINKYAQ